MIEKFENFLIDFDNLDSISLEKKNEIISKGVKQGFNRDELSLYIDNKISSKNFNKTSTIKTCPSCGSDIKLFSVKCSDCGIYFSNVSASAEIQKFNSNFFKIVDGNNLSDTTKFLQNFQFPNDTQTLIELLINSESLVFKKPTIYQTQINTQLQKFAKRIIDKIEIIKMSNSKLAFLEIFIKEFKENSEFEYMTTIYLKETIIKSKTHTNRILISLILLPIILFFSSKPGFKEIISEEFLGTLYVSTITIIPLIVIYGFIDIKKGNNVMKYLDQKTKYPIFVLLYK